MPFNYQSPNPTFTAIGTDLIQAGSKNPFQIAGEAMTGMNDIIDNRNFRKSLEGAKGTQDLANMVARTPEQQQLFTQKSKQFQALDAQKQTEQLLGLRQGMLGLEKEKFSYNKQNDRNALDNALEIEKSKQAFNLMKQKQEQQNKFDIERFKRDSALELENIKSGTKLTPVKKAIQQQAGETLAKELVKTEKDIGKEFEDYQEDKNIFWDVGLGKEETETLSNWNKAFLSRIDIPDESKIAFSAMNPMQKAKILAAVNNQTVEEADVIDFLKPKWMGGSDYRFEQIKP